MLAAEPGDAHTARRPFPGPVVPFESGGCWLVPIVAGAVGVDDWRMVQLAIRCQAIAPISPDELQGWLELEAHELRAAVPHGTVRLSRLTQEGPNADLDIGWLIELELAEGEPLLGEDRLADALRDMRLLGLEPRLLVPLGPNEARNGHTAPRGGKDSWRGDAKLA
jgi:hypothetical protein